MRRLFRLPRRSARMIAEEVEAELAFHFEARVEQLQRRGLSVDEARAEAGRRFGDVDTTRRALRASLNRREGRMRRRERLEQLLFDLRYALRQLRNERGFTIVAVLTLAIGVAAATVMFGVVDQLMLRPPPHLRDPAQLGRVYLGYTSPQGEELDVTSVSYYRYHQLRSATRDLVDLAAVSTSEGWLGEGAAAERVQTGAATASLFPVLGVRPALGRFFTEAEDTGPDGARVAVLGHALWQRRFGGDSAVLGRSVRLGAGDYTVIGVAPPRFSGVQLQVVDVWTPAAAVRVEFSFLDADWATRHNFNWLELVARLRPGVSREQAASALRLAYARSLVEESEGRRDVASLRATAQVGSVLRDRGPQPSENARVSVWLTGVAALVVLIACANVANLLLARAVRRRRELAVRVALGVSRARLVGQLLLESLLLAAAAGLVAMAVVQWGGAFVRSVLLPNVPWTGALGDRRVLLFALGTVAATTLLCGVVPALHASRPSLTAVLRTGERGGGTRRGGVRTTLLVLQAALSVVLLVGAGLFVRSLHNVRTRDLGFTYDRQVIASIDFRGARPADTLARVALERRLLDALRAVPGVERATTTGSIPFQRNMTTMLFRASGDTLPDSWNAYQNMVGPDYFATLGMRIERGRAFDDRDVLGAPGAMIVSASMARRYWPGQEALGQCVRIGSDSLPCTTIVGVAANAVQDDFAPDSVMQFWWPAAQKIAGQAWAGAYVARVRGDPGAVAAAARRALQAELPGDAVAEVRPLRELVEPSMRPWRLGATMFVAFGALSLLIAAIGLYGVVAYQVNQRRHEVGVRMALGARAGDVVRGILGEGVRLAAVGIAVGAAIALVAGRWVAPLLFDVSPHDPLIFAVVAATLLLAAVVASLVPARRAARVDPVEALRGE